MIAAIIRVCLANKILVLLTTAVLVACGIWSARTIAVDAIPDLSDVQVIIRTDYAGQAPQIVEDQVTYPLTTAMLSVPKTKNVRGFSMFGSSFVYIIFEDDTDLYWARSRVLEQLSTVTRRLPQGVSPQLGPDATGVGWVYQYVLTTDPEAEIDLAQLRSIQDWYLRPELTTVQGVSEVASVGGMVRQYQVTVDPVRLQAHDVDIAQLRQAIANSNRNVGGRLLERAETEYMVESEGYLGTGGSVIADLKAIVVHTENGGVPVTLADVADIVIGPQIRRGIAELDGQGEVAGGIVVMRAGENALSTIQAIEQRLEELKAGLPEGVHIVPTYDRSDLVERAVGTLTRTLIEEILVVSAVVLIFLLHARSALVAALVLPTGVLGSLIIMHLLGINANIMSLGGIAIAIGVMVDSAIIMVENAHNALERERKRVAAGEDPRSRSAVIAEAAVEVGPTLFFSLLIITISFIPVFVLTGQSGRLFTPLAYTKTFAMAVAAVLSITLIPVAMALFIRGRVLSEDRNPISRLLRALYNPIFTLAMRFKVAVLIVACLAFTATWFPWSKIGSEFMPPLEEGDFLYMPNTDPGLSVTKARELLQQTDKILSSFPEIKRVMGKIGRADTATDPAPLTMIETTIMLERDKQKWRKVQEPWLWGLFYTTRPITLEELTDGYALPNGTWVPGVNEALRIPGLTGALTRGAMPIRTRIDMLATGIKTPVGIKVMGPDLNRLSEITSEIETVLRTDPSIAPITASVAADRVTGGNYVTISIDRWAAQRHGLTVGAIQDVIMTALGGMTVTMTVEGLERYPVNLRYPRELREDTEQIGEVLVRTPTGAHVPLVQLARIEERSGPPMIKSENARLSSWLYITPHISDMGGYVAQAKAVVADRVTLPAGYSFVWSGQFEYMEEANQRLLIAIPLALAAILVLLYCATKSWVQTAMIFLAVPFSAIGAVWMLYALDYNMSVAVAVGIIALLGLDAETGLVMLYYLRDSCKKYDLEGRLKNRNDLWWAIHDGAVQRIRPKTMTVCTTMIGLMPLMFGDGAGADTMKRLAAPMIGGLATSFVAELLLYPILWYVAEARKYPIADANSTSEISR